MGEHTKIEWTETTWNPVTGCNYTARIGKPAAGRLLDGLTWDEYPEVRLVPGSLLKIPEAAARLAVSEDTVRRLIKAGKLGHVKVASLIRLRPEDIEAYILGCAGQAADDNEESTCKSAKETKTESINAPGRRSGGQAGSMLAANRLAARLGFGSKTTPGR